MAFGDLIAIILFVVVGRSSHGFTETRNTVRVVLDTAVPMMVGWMLAGMALGGYRGTALYPLGRVVWRTLLVGAVGGPLGVALRALWLHRPVLWSFVLVATGTSTLFLLVWRLGWSRVRRLWWPELP